MNRALFQARPILACCICIVCAFAGASADTLQVEVWKKLDRFEEHTLAMADQAFEKKSYPEAVAKYDAFLTQYPRSRAAAYALFKKARSLHMDDKRFQAIKVYNEVMDYFGNDIPIAATTLYHAGQAHRQNGDIEKAMTAWLEMATDRDYRRHPLAAYAINNLADNLMIQGKAAQAVPYFERVAVEFRHTNPDPAFHALNEVVRYYVSRTPREPKLREFYRQVGSFERRPAHIPDTVDLAADRDYWRAIWVRIWNEGHNSFTERQARERKAFFLHWADVFEPRMPQWEEFQIHAANMRLESTGDTQRWLLRMDELYAMTNTEDVTDRTLRWMRMFQGHKAKVIQYCRTLDFATLDLKRLRVLMDILARETLADPVFDDIYKRFVFDTMSDNDIRELAFIVYEKLGRIELGSRLIMRIRLPGLSDDEKSGLHRSVAKFDPTLVKRICAAFDDTNRGKFELLEFYHSLKQSATVAGRLSMDMADMKKERMALADELVLDETYANRAWWMKAQFLHWDGRFTEAIACYRSADNPPDNMWAIVNCLVSLGQIDNAISELLEIETYHHTVAPRAAYAMAGIYRQAARKDDEIGALRRVLKKYPGSNESCEAHVRLEDLGVPYIPGGLDAGQGADAAGADRT